MNDIFKCRSCGEKYNHDEMADDDDISICKWCSGAIE
jgi:formylmethanofuran dehydrogenase subunit E